MARPQARQRSPRPAMHRCGGWGSRRSTSIISTRTTERAAGGKPRRDGCAGEGRQGAGHRAVPIFGWSGSTRRASSAERTTASPVRAADLVQYGRARRSWRASFATLRSRKGWVIPFYASPTASSPASTGARTTSTKASRACATSNISKGEGDARARSARPGLRPRPAPRSRPSRLAWTMPSGVTSTLASATSVDQLKHRSRPCTFA